VSLIEAREYKTESTGFVFRIEPSVGIESPMHCSLKQNGELLWGREFPWTFSAACLAPDGTVVGYSNARALHIVTINAKGDLLKEHCIAENTWPLHSAGFPRARGPVLIQPLAGVAWLQLFPEQRSSNSGALDPWKVIRLLDGEFLDDIVLDFPITPLEGQYLSLMEGRAIGDSGLMLLGWRISDRRLVDFRWTRYGSIFSLVDSKGATIWRLSLSDDHSDSRSADLNYLVSDELAVQDMIHSVGPGARFSLRRAKDGQCVDYEVQRHPSSLGGWRVVERGSFPYRGGVSWAALPTTGILPQPSTSDLLLPPDDPAFARERSIVTIDRSGRILVSDSETGAIHAFDSHGTPIARGSDLRDGLPDDESVKELDSIERSGGGIQLDCITARALLPDGKRVVLRTRLGPTLYPGLYLYHPGCTPSSSVLLPIGPDYDWISTSARWIAVGGGGSKFALANLEDRKVLVCDPGIGTLHDWRCGLTADGHALFFVNTKTLRLVRYELP